MSRYDIKALDDTHTVVVGWDPPLNSFFAQVKVIGADEEAEPVLWVGATAPQIHDIAELRQLLAPYAVIPSSVYAHLVNDSD